MHSPFLHGVLAFTLWGLFPVYFKLVQAASPDEILAHRIIWSALVLGGVLYVSRRLPVFWGTLASVRLRLGLLLSSLIIALNWLIFVWAVNNQHALQASLGYFICPLLNCLFGYLFYGERLNRWQQTALGFAIVGVAVPLLALGRIPWVSLSLALSFSVYGTLRKKIQADPIAGLCVETVFLFPPALAWLAWLAVQGDIAFAALGPTLSLALAMSGVVTSLPLVLFASAANRIPLTALGFLQYITPSMQFVLAVFAFGEAFAYHDALSFAFIWSGLALYSLDQLRRSRSARARLA